MSWWGVGAADVDVADDRRDHLQRSMTSRRDAPGQSVTVTATLEDAGVAGPIELPAGWTEATPTTATYDGDVRRWACTPVVPADPEVMQATCVNGAVTVPTVTPPGRRGSSTASIRRVRDDGTAEYTVTVTATLTEGHGGGRCRRGGRRAVERGDGDVDGDVVGDVVCRGDAGGAGGEARRCVVGGVLSRADVDVADDRRDHLQRR